MTAFKIKLSKDKSQQNITIRRDDNVDLSAVTSITAKVYTDDLATPDNAFDFTAQNVTDFVAGEVTVTTEDLLGGCDT